MSQHTIPTASGRRAAATWVTATGVMLLLAAATLFVAVRWDQIPDGAKLAALGLVTIGALLGGRSMARALPATGDVVFHLGALLIPLDLAAALTRAGIAWPAFVLAEGMVSAVVFTVLAAVTGSVTLRIAAWVSVPVAAAGVAACTPLPAAAVLAGGALAAYLTACAPRARSLPRVRSAAVAWAALAATGPVLGAAGALLAGVDGFRIGLGTLTALGLAGHAFAWAALPTGVASAVVLGVEANERRDLRLAFATFVAIAVGAGTALTGSDVAPGLGLVAIAAAFATLELVALALATDEFWCRPLNWCASVGEAVALLPTVVAGYLIVVAPFQSDGPWASTYSFGADRSLAAALALVALGWLSADTREVRAPSRRTRKVAFRHESSTEQARGQAADRQSTLRSLASGSGRAGFTVMIAAPLVASVLAGTGSSRAVAIALLVVSAAAVSCRRAGSRPMAAAAVPFAVVCAGGTPLAAVALAIAGAAAIVLSVGRGDDDLEARLLASSAALTLVVGGAFAAFGIVDSPVAIALAAAGTIIGLWLLALALDVRFPGTGIVARVAGVLPVLVAVSALSPVAMIGPIAVATVLTTIDAVSGGRPRELFAPAILVQLLTCDVAIACGRSSAEAGLALCSAAAVWTAIAALVRPQWRDGVVVAAVIGVVVGLDLAAREPSALATAVMIAGLLVVSVGLLARRAWVAHLGAAVATAGLFGHLAIAGLGAAEWYLTPLTLQALVAGWQLRRRDGVSSWVAYAPAIVFLGGTALVERVAGGSAGHALFCGAVGVAAVAIGGWRRLSAPLVVGTGLLVAVSVHESLSSLAGIATWMWFAAGGIALVAVGVALERSDRGPVEAGRRLAEVLGERFG